ncbi:hypothetical protein D9M70_301630 [compost metagenome]
MLWAEAVIRNPLGAAGWLWITVPVELRTIQPCCQPPDEAQVVPFEEAQSVTGSLRLIASLRASATPATKSLAWDRSLLPKVTSVKLGTAIPRRIARTASVTINSTNVKPDCLDKPQKVGLYTRSLISRFISRVTFQCSRTLVPWVVPQWVAREARHLRAKTNCHSRYRTARWVHCRA